MSTPNRARKRLPIKPSAENLKKQAKRYAKKDAIPLAEAQHRIAVEYGCRNWAEFMHVVETMAHGADQLIFVERKVEPLPAAVRARDVVLVRAILASGQFTQHDLDAGLAHAAWYGGDAPDVLAVRSELFELLLSHGADPDGQYGSAYGPIVFGTGECLDPHGLQWLIDAGADVTFRPVDTKYGMQCPLSHWLGAYGRGHNDQKHRGIEILLQHKAFIPLEVTPPILAIHRGDAAKLADLLQQNSSWVHQNFADMPYGNVLLAGASLLHCAVEFDEVECCKVLLDHHADINHPADVIGGIGGQTPIFHLLNTIWDSHLATLEYLAKHFGQTVNLSIRATWRTWHSVRTVPVTPLEYAMESGDEKWRKNKDAEIALLAAMNAARNPAPSEANTELWLVCQSQVSAADRLAAARKLLAAGGVDVNRRCENGSTALHVAALRGPAELVTLLLDHDARAWIEDQQGQTPADYARRSESNPDREKIIQLLTGVRYNDVHFEQAVAAMDAGDVDRLKQLLRDYPYLVTMRLKSDSALTRGYFAQPTLLHFVANNPNRLPTMPPRILESAAAILDAGADVDAKTPHANGGTTLALVASSEPAKQADLQIPLLELLVARGADPSEGLWAAILHRYTQAVEALLRLGAKHSLASAAGMGDTETVRQLLQNRPNQDELLRAAWAAAINGAAGTMELLLDAGVNINARLPRPFEPTLLHEAAGYNHRAFVELLVKHGADLSLRDTQYEGTPADWARHAGHHDLVQWLEGWSPDQAILDAVMQGDRAHLAQLLDRYPEKISVTGGPWNKPLLHNAAWKGHLAIVEELLQRGVDVNLRDADDRACAIHFAAERGHLEIVKRLAAAGADLEGTGNDHDLNVLGWATSLSQVNQDVANFLISRGATMTIWSAIALARESDIRELVAKDASVLRATMSRNEYRCMPLHHAVAKNRPAMVRLLLELGADPSAHDARGFTALGFANESTDPEIIRLLEQAGISPGFYDRLVASQWTRAEQLLTQNPARIGPGGSDAGALAFAVTSGRWDIAEWLVAHGCAISERVEIYNCPATALHFAIEQASTERILWLLDHGADPAIRDGKFGGSALDWANHFHRDDVVQAIKSRAATH